MIKINLKKVILILLASLIVIGFIQDEIKAKEFGYNLTIFKENEE
jgi:hypothetical protein